MVSALLPRQLAKEIRPLLPVWLGSLAVLLAARLLADPKYYAMGLLVTGMASVALGALSIGHEYTNRTLGLLLSQPGGRRRLFFTKAGALVPLVLTLAVSAWLAFLRPLHALDAGRSSHRWDEHWSMPIVIVLPLLVSVLLAPLLTMACRGTLAGMVFSACVFPIVMFAARMLALARYGWIDIDSPRSDRLAMLSFWWGVAAVSVAAAIAAWPMFRRLEVVEGARDLHFPDRWRRAAHVAAPVRRHPIALLIGKELRLQQMAFVVAALYVVGVVALFFVSHFMPDTLNPPPLGALAVLYPGLQAILIGSLASAEEHQLGTIAWQLLLPVSHARQWLVKAGTTIVLALILGIGVAVLLRLFVPSTGGVPFNPLFFAAVTGLTITSLYVSTLCTSGLSALLIALFGTPSALLLLRWLDDGLTLALQGLGVAQSPPSTAALALSFWMLIPMVLGYFVLMLWLGLVNHRSLERTSARTRSQVVWIGGYFAACLGVQWLVLGCL